MSQVLDVEKIIFTGTIKDYQSRWYYGFYRVGFYRVKPDCRIFHPDKPKPSNALFWLPNKAVEEYVTELDLVGSCVKIEGYWYKERPAQKRHYFKITCLEGA